MAKMCRSDGRRGTQSPLSRLQEVIYTDSPLAPREDLYISKTLDVKDAAENRDEVEKRKELYPIQHMGVKDDAE